MLSLLIQNAREFFDLAQSDVTFQVVLGAFLLLVLLAMAFMMTAVVLRVRNDRRLARHERLETEWQPILLQVLAGTRPPNDLHRLVHGRDVFFFADVLYRVGRQVRGEDLQMLRNVAAPYLRSVGRLSEGDAETRARKLQIVGLLGFEKYEQEVVAALDDRSPLVAMVAARTLIRREHPEYVSFVLDRMHRFSDWSHELLSSLLAGLGPDAAPALREVLADETRPGWFRAVAARALGSLNDASSADIAAQALSEAVVSTNGVHAANALRAALLALLGRVGRGEHADAIRTLATHDDEDVRVAAYTALGHVSGSSEMSDLLRALKDSSGRVALAAARGLRRVGHIDILREMAASDHPRAELIQQVLAERVSALE